MKRLNLKHIRVLVIADDFTGALDTGIQFSDYSNSVSIISELKEDASALCDVIIYDAETRHKTSIETRIIMRRIIQWAKKRDVTHIYMKTDSALRGNIGSELGTLCEDWTKTTLVFAPAYPEMNRITKNGIQYIDQVPVAESVFGNDLFDPVRHSSITEIIGETSQVDVFLSSIPLSNNEIQRRGVSLFDAATSKDLEHIAEWAIKDNLNCFAGCAGFAKAVAKYLLGHYQLKREIQPKGKLLAVCGSINPITLEQIHVAEAAGVPCVKLFREEILHPRINCEKKEWLIKQWANLLEEKNALIFRVADENRKSDIGTSDYKIGKEISEGLADVTKAVLDYDLSPVLFCTGGDTFFSVIQKLHVEKITPTREVFPGVVLMTAKYRGNTLQIISKAGGFGSSNLLLELLDMLQEKGGKANELNK